ncbi:MAG: nucleotidyltransferase domain-containing protein [Spirochaetia bacterium]|nr:nucleotidyltransferase domain-containing protein [Spirochaetia bacterium]
MKPKENSVYATNSGKVLSFLSESPDREFTAGEIYRAAGISRPGAYLALKTLRAESLVVKVQKGKIGLFRADNTNPAVKQFKILKTVSGLSRLVSGLKHICSKIILYGSASRGEDDSKSDIDLFVLTSDREEAENVIRGFKYHRRIEARTFDAVGLSRMKREDPVHYNEVDRGIVLWEDRS